MSADPKSRMVPGPAWLVAIAAAMAVAWLQLDGAAAAARIWAAVLLVPLPALMVVQAGMLERETTLPRPQAYLSTIVSLWVLALITFGVSGASGYTLRDLGLAGVVTPITMLVAAALTAAGIALLFAFRLAGVREPAVLRELLPQTRDERLLFVAVSVSAGICEELVFRGFLLRVLDDATGSTMLAVVISSGAFGVVHAYQRSAGALRAALLGALLALPLVLGYPLHASILAHMLIDLLSGLWIAKYLLR